MVRIVVLTTFLCFVGCSEKGKLIEEPCNGEGRQFSFHTQSYCLYTDTEEGFECPDDAPYTFDDGAFIACSEEPFTEAGLQQAQDRFGACRSVACDYVAGETCERGECVVTCDVGFGSLTGLTCAPTGDPIGGATVEVSGVDCEGNAFTLTTTSDMNGDYTLDPVPSGNNLTVTVTLGQFSSENTFRMNPEEDVKLDERSCIQIDANVAVIQGSYDFIEGILGTLRVPYDIVGSDNGSEGLAFLTNLNQMMAYDILFINCGSFFEKDEFNMNLAAIGDTLRQFVQGGGSVYVSDWSHPFVEAAFPDMVDWVGQDEEKDEVRSATSGTVPASVVDPRLRDTLGTSSVDVLFDFSWAGMEFAPSTTTVHLDATIEACPLGTCTQITNSPLIVSHREPSGGTMLFTSFHNSLQASAGTDIELILLYLVFLL